MDIGSHRINLFLDLFGAVRAAKAQADTLMGDDEAEDCMTLLVRFASGVHGTLQCFFGTSWGADDFTVLGTRGRSWPCRSTVIGCSWTSARSDVWKHTPQQRTCTGR